MSNKEEIRNIILDCINEETFPTITVQNVIDSLPKMWDYLKDKGLIPEGMTFKDFQQICVHEHNNAFIHHQMMGNRKAPPIFVKSKVVASNPLKEKNEQTV